MLNAYSMFASKITDYYLCARAFRNELHSDPAYAYLAMLLEANPFISKGKINAEIIYDICRNNADRRPADIVEYLTNAIVDLEIDILSSGNSLKGQASFFMEVHQNKDVIRDAVVEKLKKAKPGFFTVAAAKAFYEKDIAEVALATNLARETDLYFK